MKRKEIVQINGNDDNNQISFRYETTPVSDIQGASPDKPIFVEDDGVETTPRKYFKGESSMTKFVVKKEDDDVKVMKVGNYFKGESSITKFVIEEEDVKVLKVVKVPSYPPLFTCEICTDPKPIHGKFRVKGCDHCYCSECIALYVASRIEENITHVTCPVSDCISVIEPLSCQEILPRQVFDRWGDALCEAVISASERFYCPFKDCSALLIDDGCHGEKVMKQSECPYCNRLFCVQCKISWHTGLDCADIQKLNENEREREDIMLMTLAKKKKWKTCPKCKFIISRSEGCLFMKCRCGFTFCYNCGAQLKEHYCTVCKH